MDSREDSSNCLSNLTFYWFRELAKLGYQRQLKSIDQLYSLPSSLNVESVSARFQSFYVGKVKHKSSEDTRLSWAFLNGIFKCLGLKFILLGMFHLIIRLKPEIGLTRSFVGVFQISYDLLQFSSPMLLNLMVINVEKQDGLKAGYVFALLLVVCSLALAFMNVHINYTTEKFCLQIRTILLSLMYRKVCFVKTSQLSSTSASFTIANVSSFISADIDMILYALPNIHLSWSKPIQLLVAFYLLYDQIGVSFVVGMLVVVLLIPLNKLISKKIGVVFSNLMHHKDKRVQVGGVCN
jgi:ATP-binding cassette subfamily C (CFTR/MRP) protein 10